MGGGPSKWATMASSQRAGTSFYDVVVTDIDGLTGPIGAQVLTN